MSCIARPKYTGSTPGADTNAYTLFDTTVAYPGASYLPMHGVARINIDINHDEAGDLKWYKSHDRGATWIQISSDSISAPASPGVVTTIRDILVEGYRDFKVDWVNGGTAQSSFEVDMALVDDRSPAS